MGRRFGRPFFVPLERFSSEVDAGSREKNTSEEEARSLKSDLAESKSHCFFDGLAGK
jgi:hypothetical protein